MTEVVYPRKALYRVFEQGFLFTFKLLYDSMYMNIFLNLKI